ncbi:hypothetical protein [uncultured Marixanthomonas sp.]|uniref:hypothetical protein n=1 Tax=uncultured Marixanthomonas sp. TaxID=757245 RepID=UPI0030D7C563|tara:strand:+ start:295 stop:903 length:609 start_codon:yes stop_codon:yes gene_type:complete
MNNIKLICIIALLSSFCVFSQERNWITEKSKDGKSTVKYELVKENKGTHFYYIAQTTANVSLEELDAYFSNTSNHKYFLERTTTTEEFKKISDNEWLAYYFFDAPWPLPNSDIVIKISRVIEDNKLTFTAASISNDYKKSDVERMTTYKVIYEFKKINNFTTKITYNANYIPVGSIPRFLIKSWFPEGPANIVTNLGEMKKK